MHDRLANVDNAVVIGIRIDEVDLTVRREIVRPRAFQMPVGDRRQVVIDVHDEVVLVDPGEKVLGAAEGIVEGGTFTVEGEETGWTRGQKNIDRKSLVGMVSNRMRFECVFVENVVQ